MMGKHILSQKNILYYMTVFMYDHIENSLSKCLVNILHVFLFKFKTLILIQINIKDAGLHLLITNEGGKKCTKFLLEVTVRICKVLFCHTTDL